MKKRAVIATLLKIADNLDNTARYQDATILTRVAQRIAQYEFPETHDPNIHLKEQHENQGDDFEDLMQSLGPDETDLLLGGAKAGGDGLEGDMGSSSPMPPMHMKPRRPAPMMDPMMDDDLDPDDPYANE